MNKLKELIDAIEKSVKIGIAIRYINLITELLSSKELKLDNESHKIIKRFHSLTDEIYKEGN